MIKIFTLFIALIISIPSFSQAQWTWAHQLGGRNNTSGGAFLGRDNSGALYMAGDFTGTRNFGTTSLTATGAQDAFIGKLDTTGDFAWIYKAGGNGANVDVRASYTASNGNTYLTGKFTGQGTITFGTFTLTSTSPFDDMFIACFNNQGTVTWAERYGSAGSSAGTTEGRAIYADNAGNIYVAGAFSSSVNFGSFTLTAQHQFNTDIFVLKMDSTGNVLWAKRAGSATQEDKGNGITVDGAGNVYVTGTYKQTADFDSYMLTSNGAYDMFLAKYDSNGGISWAVKAGGSGFDRAAGGNALALDQNNNIYVTGLFNGTNVSFGGGITLNETVSAPNVFYGDFFVAKYNNSGTALWAKKGGGPSVTDSGNAIDVDAQGNVYITGSFQGNAMFDAINLVSSGIGDAFIIRYSSSGSVNWALKLGAGNEDVGKSVIVDAPNKTFVSGYFTGNINVASTTLTSPANTWQIFFARVDAGTTAVVELTSVALEIFPNPATDILYFEGKDLKSIEINDQTGKLVYSSEVNSGINSVDVSGFEKGIYFIKVKDKKTSGISKLVIN